MGPTRGLSLRDSYICPAAHRNRTSTDILLVETSDSGLMLLTDQWGEISPLKKPAAAFPILRKIQKPQAVVIIAAAAAAAAKD